MAGYLKINGVTIKTPKKFTAGIQGVDGDSGRNAKGDMVRDYITTKRKMDLEWGRRNFANFKSCDASFF